jgi:hypothetical protein
MRLSALLLALLTTSLFAADEPKKTETPSGETPATKPAEKPAVKAKKTMGIPEIPEGISIPDGVKLQAAWVKAKEDASLKSGDDKPKGDDDKKKKGEAKGKGGRAAGDEALAKAMLKADPSLKPELVRAYLEASHQKAKDGTKGKKK